MKRVWLLLAALVLPMALQAQAVDVVGTWQGTLEIPNAPRPLRQVLKISKDDNILKVKVYSIDQGGNAINASSASLKGDMFSLEVVSLAMKYEGKVAADGKSMTGTFNQAGRPLPLNLAKVAEDAAWEIPKPAERPKPMAKDYKLTFEVATIKPSNPDERGMGFNFGQRKFRTINTTLVDILKFVYNLQDKQMIGLPAWANEDKWSIDAQPDGEGQPSGDQYRYALGKLLDERFQLKWKNEEREMSVYLIEAAKGGSKMTKSDPQGDQPGGMLFRGPGIFTASNANMDDFANLLQATLLDRPVLDKTGFGSTRYDFKLEWQPDATQFGGRFANAPVFDPPRPELYTAVQEQLGVKITPSKAPAKVMVFEKAEKPSQN